ncbi:MAG: acetylglutamate kinase [Elusimicrobia bacterium RIFCSPLOWO2_01_FULL_59_12]|nr:MAG: acetylglutamate kinase [Elusimicrobia bacterium RIFCSPLOWO2_01_FULL_59_12]
MLDPNVIVIKYGGSLLEDPAHRRDFLKDIAALSKKVKVVLVHGGGKEITRALDQKGIQARFVDGLRVTDEATMDVVEDVLARLNREIVRELEGFGVRAEGYSGKSDRVLSARPIPDLGRVGKPEHVDLPVFGRLLARPPLPVFYSVAVDSVGRSLNINADDFALALALACRAQRLVFLTDSGGVLDSAGKQIPTIDRPLSENLIGSGVITGGMLVKARASLDAVEKGVGSVDITKNIKYLLTSDETASAVTRFTGQAA